MKWLNWIEKLRSLKLSGGLRHLKDLKDISNYQINIFIGVLFVSFIAVMVVIRMMLVDISSTAAQKAGLKPVTADPRLKQESKRPEVAQRPERERKEWVEPIFCHHIQQGRLYLPKEYMFPILRRQTNAVVLPKSLASCAMDYAVNFLSFTNYDTLSGLPWRYWLDQPVRHLAVSDYSSFVEFENEALTSGQETKARVDLFRQIMRSFSLAEPVVYIRFELGNLRWSPSHFGAPLIHPLARTVEASEVKRHLQAGEALALDVRRLDVKPVSAIKNALKWPVPWKQVRMQFHPPSTLRHIPFDQKKLNDIPRTQTLIVFAENEKSAAAYNAISWLYGRGYKRLLYFRGGVSEWLKEPVVTPDRVGAVRVIGSSELNELMQSKIQLIDVRRDRRFYGGTIPSAQHVYVSPDDDQGAIIKRFKGVKLQDKVVVFGHNEMDWSAYRAARALYETTSSQIYWLRNGYSQWRFAAKVLGLDTVKPERKSLPPGHVKSKRVAPAVKYMDKEVHVSVPPGAQ